ncbi:hypothetical protein AKJ16_DCAP04820 [Drosera capensis]
MRRLRYYGWTVTTGLILIVLCSATPSPLRAIIRRIGHVRSIELVALQWWMSFWPCRRQGFSSPRNKSAPSPVRCTSIQSDAKRVRLWSRIDLLDVLFQRGAILSQYNINIRRLLRDASSKESGCSSEGRDGEDDANDVLKQEELLIVVRMILMIQHHCHLQILQK